MGAAFLAAAGGRHYYEVEVLEAADFLFVGFAGTNFGPHYLRVGDDACSWSCRLLNGDGYHGCVKPA